MNYKRNISGNYVIIIDEENSLLAKLIRDNFIQHLRRRRSEFEVISFTIDEAEHLITEYQLSEFPSILYFKKMKLIKKIHGFSYFEQKVKDVA